MACQSVAAAVLIPDITLPELKQQLARKGAHISEAALWRLRRRKHAAEQDRPDVLKRRRAWFESQLDPDPARLVFIDETWASTNMARRYGRAPRGTRLRVGVPHQSLFAFSDSVKSEKALATAPVLRRGHSGGAHFGYQGRG